MPDAYLTIDDSPTKHTNDFVDFLEARDIPAVFFCIGGAYEDLGFACEGMEQNPDPIIRAIERGFVIGNHTYSHGRFSDISLEKMKEDVLKTEGIIDDLYRQAGRVRPVKLFRFPHIDRGCGAWPFDLDELSTPHKTIIEKLFCEGLNVRGLQPTEDAFKRKESFQDFLKSEGFRADVFQDIHFEWYKNTEMALAHDSLMTYSTSDWMINPDFATYAKEHNWTYPNVEALKKKMDDDPWLCHEDSRHIILAHDHNNLFTGTTELITHMLDKGITFQEIKA